MTQMQQKHASTEPAWERHYTVLELAKQWGFSRTTVRRWFEDEPGVLRMKGRIYFGRRNPYVRLRIPQSVAQRVYLRHLIHPDEAPENPQAVELVRKMADNLNMEAPVVEANVKKREG